MKRLETKAFSLICFGHEFNMMGSAYNEDFSSLKRLSFL